MKKRDNKRVEISFKNTTKDTKLFLEIDKLEEKSATIKEILYKVLVEGKQIWVKEKEF